MGRGQRLLRLSGGASSGCMGRQGQVDERVPMMVRSGWNVEGSSPLGQDDPTGQDVTIRSDSAQAEAGLLPTARRRCNRLFEQD
jgi:hypothetical protein